MFDTTNREIFSEWGISDSIFIDGKELGTGPPKSYRKIKRKIERRLKQLIKI
ncbi:MAG: hypothetical protein U9R19_09985 [Bacteroidota bacterium]|nr:hypothetical protein [Bacteroidota bacterium]